MKGFYLATGIFFSFLILILAFENIFAKTRYFLLLFSSVDNLGAFLIILIIAILGIITGIFYALFLTAAIESYKDGDDES